MATTTTGIAPVAEWAAREDELLALRCQLGEADAFADLIRRWNDPLWRYLRRIASNDADAQELAQEVWLRVVRGISRLRDPATLRPWLFGIARRVAMDHLRERYRQPPTIEVDESLDPAAIDAINEDLHEDLATLEDELRRLPVVEREVLTLFYLRELSLAQVAAVLTLPVGTVKSRLFRARKLLRQEMAHRHETHHHDTTGDRP
jgi:RNA polymerase sigma-70 factor (ECF subfamily)